MHVNRRIFRPAGVVVAALAAVALTAGCGDTSHGGGHTGDHGVATAGVASSPSAGHNQADIAFAQGMIPHHQQAVQMAELAEGRAGDPRVTALAAKIKAAQAPEIDQMTTWLTNWAAPLPSPSAAGHDTHGAAPGGMHGGTPGGGMPGMMADQDMTSLEAASGSGFDRMFLEMMIRHHQGAVQMASAELGHGQNPAAKGLAEKVKADQSAEIDQMQSLLSGR